jgi:hypothetical protein
VNLYKKNNKVMYVISCFLQFVSGTVHRVLLVLSTSSEVDYIPVIELTTYGLELTFSFFFGWVVGGCNRMQDKLSFSVCTCACVCCVLFACVYMVCVCRYIV